RQVAVQHPVTGAFGVKLQIASLGDANDYCVARIPGGLWHSAALGSCYVKLVSMQVNRVMIHAEIHNPDSDSISESDEKWCRRRCGLTIDRQPVEFHGHGIDNRVVWQCGPFLNDQSEVFLNRRIVVLPGVNNEQADHAHHLLHGAMGMVEECSTLI